MLGDMMDQLSTLIGFAVRMGRDMTRNWKVVSSATKICPQCQRSRVWMYEARSLFCGKERASGWFARVCLCTVEARKLDLRAGREPQFRVYSACGQPANWDEIPPGSHIDALREALFPLPSATWS